MRSFDVPEPDFDRYTNRQLAAVPLALLALALVVVGANVMLIGAPAPLGIEFTGGTELVIDTTGSADDVRTAFDTQPEDIQTVQGQSNRYIVTFGPDAGENGPSVQDQANDRLEPPSGNDAVVQGVSSVDATFAENTQRLALIGIIAAFVGMSVIAFALFRVFVPSVAIVISAFSDIMIPLALMGIVGYELSLGTVAALLMLIGYSVDSDILLNNHVLRRGTGGDFYDDVHRSMKTGVTMTVTSMAAMATMAIVAYLFGIDLLTAIGTILFVGLAADIMNTYMLNVTLLRWYKFEGVKR
ncbi:preprotein translocase subunit SecF [Salinarchaeum sp. Harcht-Bsk1]|uniref:protein translocase subunit SecF n=1 Tax=Salinarchaeum sp. Harcht-Bsk1 TaxID=1333523 RepID=UPI0003424915|nr:protein translocase subunit SecF [Salinarchaeum sp. Harcht-Bsk1]AGN02352.1 preprotein translocase subunit SecF [Salinarchaeum sp. Harcht-Bsk1]